MMTNKLSIYNSMKVFADSIKTKMNQFTFGEPEDQLRAPFELHGAHWFRL